MSGTKSLGIVGIFLVSFGCQVAVAGGSSPSNLYCSNGDEKTSIVLKGDYYEIVLRQPTLFQNVSELLPKEKVSQFDGIRFRILADHCRLTRSESYQVALAYCNTEVETQVELLREKKIVATLLLGIDFRQGLGYSAYNHWLKTDIRIFSGKNSKYDPAQFARFQFSQCVSD